MIDSAGTHSISNLLLRIGAICRWEPASKNIVPFFERNINKNFTALLFFLFQRWTVTFIRFRLRLKARLTSGMSAMILASAASLRPSGPGKPMSARDNLVMFLVGT